MSKETRNQIILILLGIFTSFIIIEVGYQSYILLIRPVVVFRPDGSALNPNGSGEYRGGYASLDKFGLRNNIDSQALTRKNKILVVGDSVTFGMGVNDEDVFVHLLNNLNNKNGTGFVNLGQPGFDTALLRIHFLKYHKKFIPYNGIIWVYNINDARLNNEFISINPEIIQYEYYSSGPNKIENFIWPHLKSPTLLKYLIRNLKNIIRNNNNIDWKNYYEMCLESYKENSKKSEIERKYLQEIINWSKKLEIPLGFVLVPVTDQFKDDRVEPQNFIKSIASENNIPVLDLMPLFRNLKRPIKDFYLPGDHGHLNSEGNKYLALWINHFLQLSAELSDN